MFQRCLRLRSTLPSCLRPPNRSYISRAHPSAIPEYSVVQALQETLSEVEQRQKRRYQKWNRQQTKGRTQKPEPDRMDETIELALNLNLDPKKPGQALRGSVLLPNGSGKKISCIVFTSDPALQDAALQAGALHAGGTELLDRIAQGEIPINFQRSLATTEMMTPLSKSIARILGPRGLMPNAKTGTLVSPADLPSVLETQLAGKEVPYRTDREGIIHTIVGKGSFGTEKLLENIEAVMKKLFAVKPEFYGKDRKKKVGKGAKYLLRASISSTQGKGRRLDVRTIDPTSSSFLVDARRDQANLETQQVA